MAVRGPQLDDQLCFALYDASRALIRAYGPLLEPLGITYPQYLALLALWEADGPITVGVLGERLGLDSGTLTPLLKRLEQIGLITRRRDPADERRVMVTLTAEGDALREPATRIPACLGERLGDVGDIGALRDRVRDFATTVKRAESARR